MTARHNIGASIESAEAVTGQDGQIGEMSLGELTNRLIEVSETVQAYAYQAAGRTNADVVAELIIVAAELERLASRLER